MVAVSRSIHIDAPVERVFALMADPLARSRLHPDAEPIRVEIEGGGPLRAGGVCHFRLQIGNRIADYRTRVRELEPARRIVSLSDSAVPFEVRIETEPEDRGTRLTQTETFEPSDEMLIETSVADSLTRKVLQVIEPIMPLFDPDYARRIRGRQEELLTQRLEKNLDRWLAAIKRHLEQKANGQD